MPVLTVDEIVRATRKMKREPKPLVTALINMPSPGVTDSEGQATVELRHMAYEEPDPYVWFEPRR